MLHYAALQGGKLCCPAAQYQMFPKLAHTPQGMLLRGEGENYLLACQGANS